MAEELAHHGYQISPGSLYPTLHKMETEGLLTLEPADRRRAGRGGRTWPRQRVVGPWSRPSVSSASWPTRCSATGARERRARSGDRRPARAGVAVHDREGVARLGCIGFGGPPTHIALLRRMCVEERRWIGAKEFEDAIATTNLLPGPASTQLAIFCAWRLRGAVGAIVGGAVLHRPGPRAHPGPVGRLPGRPPARLDSRRGGRRRRGRAGGRAERRVRAWPRPAGSGSAPSMPPARLAGSSTASSAAPPQPPSGRTWCSCWSPAG